MGLQFVKNFLGEVREAGAVRTLRPAPQSAWLVPMVITFVIAYIIVAIVFPPSGKAPSYHFVSEKSSVPALSAIFLAMGCGFAGATFLIATDFAGRQRTLWLMLTLTLGYLALDELLRFHEQMGKGSKISKS